jgi:hypothetical protein
MAYQEARMISSERYFARRAAQEAERANRAHGAEAKRWHLELADKYMRLAKER